MKEQLERALRRLGRTYERLAELRSGRRLYIVGGTLRDIILGRELADFDFAVSGSGIEFASAFARRVRGKLVVLSEPDDEARVVWHRSVTFDFNGFGARTIEDDLARRDFTVNAIASEIGPGGPGEPLDPHSGRADIERRLIRPVSAGSLASDPLRLLRAIRLALELGFQIDEAVWDQGRHTSLTKTAGERISAELLRILEHPDAHGHIVRLHGIGRLVEILPGLAPILADDELRRHTFDTLFKVGEIVHGSSFFSRFEPEWDAYFNRWNADEPLPSESGDAAAPAEPQPGLPFRRGLLKLAGLLHDIAKPETRFKTSDGEMHFYGHDSIGARTTSRMARDRLRLSRPQVKMLKTLVQEHMRLHLLATAPDLSERAIRRYFRDLGQEAFGLMILCVADGWATAGRTGHLEETIARMIEQKRAEDARVRIERLVNGNDLIAIGMKPGPAFKVILQELEELQIEGRITTKQEGLDYLRTHLASQAAE